MVDANALVVAGVCALIGGFVLLQARSTRKRYATIDEVDTADDERLEPGGEATIRGPVRVDEAAAPARTGPELTVGGDPPALWAWRLRRKGGGGSEGSTRWRTVEDGLSVGEFAVDRGWDRVRVDASALPSRRDDAIDPFDSPQLFLGEPEEETLLGELDPINRFFERTGLAGDDGVVSDLEFSVSVGGKTNWPDKYQATVIRDGDELVVRGELRETADGYVLRETDETPLVVGTETLDDQREQLRSKLRLQRAVGGGALALGIVLAVLGLI
ncbi:hypothetical protein [Halopiger aswanensis]|uniref:Uncharacterized protein n=1 Tax=Halopiger aswanensis TaxID=148449 RepID=A0A3R7D971_9EURY|nr:hypothetical protein [Halopiger aswanensis]RKD93984.1 hypothetical protein ATJ93_3619 [Halopiger aswanensis]